MRALTAFVLVSQTWSLVKLMSTRMTTASSTQEKVPALVATDKDLNLKKITEFVLAQESGTRSSKLLGEVAGVSKISNYKREPTLMKVK